MSKDIESKQDHPVAEPDDEQILHSRRDFLLGLGKWSKAVIGGVLLGSLIAPDQAAEAGAWINRRGYGGSGWINGGGGGVGWVNRGGGGVGWINGGGGWYNRGGSWYNRGGGGGWVNRRGGGGWYNRR